MTATSPPGDMTVTNDCLAIHTQSEDTLSVAKPVEILAGELKLISEVRFDGAKFEELQEGTKRGEGSEGSVEESNTSKPVFFLV